MIKVHHLEKSRSHRVIWLLEELGLDYELVTYKRDPKTNFGPPELKAMHPLGKSPVIEDGGRVYAESAVILEHLLEAHGGDRLAPPPGTPEHDDYRFWMHFAEGSAMLPIIVKLYLGRVGEAAAALMPRFDTQLADQHALMETTLSDRDFFARGFSAADIQMSYPIEIGTVRGNLDGRYPKLQAWIVRIRARPAYQRAIERGGPVIW